MAHELAKYADKFSTEQLEALVYLTSTNMSIVEIERKVGITKSTMYRWLHDEDFKAARNELVFDNFQALSAKAVAVIEDQLDSDDKWIRQNAARLILDKVLPALKEKQASTVVQFQMQMPAMPPKPEIIEAEGDVIE